MAKIDHTPFNQTYAPLPSARWLRPFRLGWILLILLVMAVVLPGLAAYYNYLVHFYTESFSDIGLNPVNYAVYVVGLDTAVFLVHLLLAGLIVWRRPQDGMALLTAVTLTTNSAVIPISIFARSFTNSGFYEAAIILLLYLGLVTSVWMLYLFPDGRFIPRWTKITAVLWAILICLPLLLPDSRFDFSGWPLLLQGGLLLFWCGVGVWAQVSRYEHAAGPAQKQQIKWAGLGLLVAAAAPFTYYFLFYISPAFEVPDVPNLFQQRLGTELFTALVTVRFISLTAVRLLALLFPLSFAIAILRYRLWDIDHLINRTLVYGSLSGLTFGLYILIVGVLWVLLPTETNLILAILATGLIAILFQPLRQWLQAQVNRFMYGKAEDPATTLAQLGERLEATAVPEQTLPALLETITNTLCVPYAAIALLDVDDVSASVGKRPSTPLKQFPLLYQFDVVGWLLVANNESEGQFSADEERLLQNIARQAGTAVHILKLTTDLQQANEQLQQTRHVERQRLRRDLHDDLGPTLASLSLKLDAARNYAGREPAAAGQLLQEYKSQTRELIWDIRRIVQDLQPSALDQLGLPSALQAFASQREDGLVQITLHMPEQLPVLPAAVEVAAYRIITEAITNCLRHAQAQNCKVYIVLNGNLSLEIRDDGVGLPPGHHSGVGLLSMRERTEELGGTFAIDFNKEGTVITAVLPVKTSSTRDPIT